MGIVKNNGTTWLNVTAAPIPLDDAGVIILYNDVSDRKKAKDDLILARDAANIANKAKSHFLSAMSHELRTPLNAILGFGQLLEIDESLNETQLDYVTEMTKAGNYLLTLIDEILDLSKIESGKVKLETTKIDLNNLIVDAIKTIEPIAYKMNIKIIAENSGQCLLAGDEIRLKQIFLNLMSNGIKYNRENGVLKISYKEINDKCRISIKDTGKGLTEDQINTIFKPFSRGLAENSNIKGTGLGLNISKQLIELMGGSIGVISQVGTGSEFWVEIPVFKS
jgi:signal transduction histidine kinase